MTFEEMNKEAEALYAQIMPMFDRHTDGATMLVLAHLFAYWLSLRDPRELPRSALLFNNAALGIYGDMIQNDERESLH